MTVAESGTYEFIDKGQADRTADLSLGIYELGGFVSADQREGNCVASMDRERNINLAAGSYTLVVADYDPEDFEKPQVLTITGPGVITIVPADAPAGGGATRASSGAPAPRFTLSSSASDRGTCWPTVSGVGGSWVQLTAGGCTPPIGRDQATTLLGWATDPAFPVARATYGVAVDEEIAGVRMIFIPVDGYTFLSGDNTLYPVWSS